MATSWYVTGFKECFDGTIDILNDTLKIMLVKSGYVFDPDHLVVSYGAGDPLSAELTVGGYVGGWGGAGRKVASMTQQANLTDDRVDTATADQTHTALATGETIAAAILIKEGVADDTTSRLIAYWDHADTPTNGSDVTLDFATLGAGGNLQVEMIPT